MGFLNRFLKRSRSMQGLKAVRLEKIEDGVLSLSIPPEPYHNQYLWDYLQRDVILALLSGLFVMVHLDGFATLELGDDLQEVCPCQTDGTGKSFLLAGEGLLRLVTELMQIYGEYWDSGELVSFSAFSAPPALDFPPDTDLRELPEYAICIQPVGDDLGLWIDFSPDVFLEADLTARIARVAAGYCIALEMQ